MFVEVFERFDRQLYAGEVGFPKTTPRSDYFESRGVVVDL